MRDPDMFKYDVRVRDRMLRAGRITTEDVNKILEALPDLETSIESVPLNQPALDATAASNTSAARQSYPPPATASDESDGEEQDGGDTL
jgi:hypothetical protein